MLDLTATNLETARRSITMRWICHPYLSMLTAIYGETSLS